MLHPVHASQRTGISNQQLTTHPFPFFTETTNNLSKIAGVAIWGFLTFALIILINIWTYFLVLIKCRRGGDIGIVKIADEDIHRFMWISGLFGAWAGIICKPLCFFSLLFVFNASINSGPTTPPRVIDRALTFHWGVFSVLSFFLSFSRA